MLNLLGVAILVLALAMLGLRGFNRSLNVYAMHSLLLAIVTAITGYNVAKHARVCCGGRDYHNQGCCYPAYNDKAGQHYEGAAGVATFSKCSNLVYYCDRVDDACFAHGPPDNARTEPI